MLVVVVVSLIFTIAAPKGAVAVVGTAALAGAVLLAALRAAGSRTWVRVIGRGVVATALVAAVAVVVSGGSDATRGLLFLGIGAVVVWVPLVISRGVVQQIFDEGVKPNSIAGAVAIYLQLGIFFGVLVFAVAQLAPGHYFAQHASTTLSQDSYFSLTTLSTVGYGDFTPALAIGRTLSALEAVTGQLYLVTVVAVLVSNMRGRHPHGKSTAETSGDTRAGGGAAVDP